MAASIRGRIAASSTVLRDKQLDRAALLNGAPMAERLKMYLALPLGSAFDFLL